MDILSKILEDFTRSMAAALLDDSGRDFGLRMLDIQTASQEMICRMIPAMLQQMDDEIAGQARLENGWTVLRKGKRELETIFGLLRYRRRYYRSKESGKAVHLLDTHLGISPGQRVSNDVRDRAMKTAVDCSYSASGKTACPNGISKSSVANYIPQLQPVTGLQADEVKRQVAQVYVEADEDHVALQNGRNVQVKLVYVHEGREQVNGRWKLRNPRYLTCPLTQDADNLWEHVADYVEQQYDADKIEKLFIAGDAASWIRTGEEWLPGCVPILDGYHINKAVTALTAHVPKARGRAYKLLHDGDEKAFAQFTHSIIEEAPTPQDRSRKRKLAGYLLTNWTRIQNRQEAGAQGCSAEGHVSHILSARLSSRPLGWGERNLITMAQLRVMKANGQVIAYPSNSSHITAAESAFTPSRKTVAEVRKACLQTGAPSSFSLPVMAAGKTGELYHALHALTSAHLAS